MFLLRIIGCGIVLVAVIWSAEAAPENGVSPVSEQHVPQGTRERATLANGRTDSGAN